MSPGFSPHLDQGRVQVHVVGHDDSAHDAHGLLQLGGATVLAVGDEQSLQQLLLVGLHCHILGTGKKGGLGCSERNHDADSNLINFCICPCVRFEWDHSTESWNC